MITYNLTRAVGVLAGKKMGLARTATIRTNLINLPARIAYSGLIYTLHLPAHSRREVPFLKLAAAVMAPPQAA